MTKYYRAIPMTDPARPAGALPIAGGWCWFDRIEVLSRGKAAEIIPAIEAPQSILHAIASPRADISGLSMAEPQVMGILNVTPDSFSDGGRYIDPESALSQAQSMIREGATIIDVGGESTRPGAAVVPVEEETARVAQVVDTLAKGGVCVSIDTRKAPVAAKSAKLGAKILNDVSAMYYDPAMAEVAAATGLPICLMHAQGTPETMQADPRYDDVVLDVYDYLAERIEVALAAGIKRTQIIVDPGIGFGKTLQHNLALLRRMSIFHSLGSPILLGASRKRFIGEISGAQDAAERMAGSVSVALDGIRQGVQIVRVHDTLHTRQAISLQTALFGTL
jgi:dihydropteroate synthase